MNVTSNTVLITGGSQGIGFEMAKLLGKSGNTVIITGRNGDRLQSASEQIPNCTAIRSDVTISAEVNDLIKRVKAEFPTLNILINNVGKAYKYDLAKDRHAYQKASDEMLTNYLSCVRLNNSLLPLLYRQPEAAIVHVSSIAAFVGSVVVPTYSASKTALHAYTQLFRRSLEGQSKVKVFELMPPLVNTEFSQQVGGQNGLAPSVVAEALLNALANDIYEVHIGATEGLYEAYFSKIKEVFDRTNPVSTG